MEITYEPLTNYSALLTTKTISNDTSYLLGFRDMITQLRLSNRIRTIFPNVKSLAKPNISQYIMGKVDACLMFGIDPSLYNQSSYSTTVFNIPKVDETSTGSLLVPISHMENIIDTNSLQSMNYVLHQCFPDVPVKVCSPGRAFIIKHNTDIASIILISPKIMSALQYCSSLTKQEFDYLNSSNVCYIFNVAVEKNFRGQGLSKTALFWVFNTMMAEGYHNYILECLPDNKIAYSLYLQLGFKKIGTATYDSKLYDLLLLRL